MARPPTAGQPIFPQQPGPTAVRSSAGPEGSPVSDLKISDPVFTLTLARGVEKGGLFELLDAALAGELADLPAMRGVGALIQRGGRAVAGMLTIATAGGS